MSTRFGASHSCFTLASMLVFINSASAQQQTTGSGWWQNQKKQIAPAPVKKDPINNEIDLPDFPRFSGSHKFLDGSVRSEKDANTYLMTFSTKQEPKAVLDWYAESLKAYRWEVKVIKQSIIASKGKSYCAIHVNSGFTPDEKCLFRISYFNSR